MPSQFDLEKLAIAVVGESINMQGLDAFMTGRLGSIYPTLYFKTDMIPKNQNGKPERKRLTQFFLESRNS